MKTVGLKFVVVRRLMRPKCSTEYFFSISVVVNVFSISVNTGVYYDYWSYFYSLFVFFTNLQQSEETESLRLKVDLTMNATMKSTVVCSIDDSPHSAVPQHLGLRGEGLLDVPGRIEAHGGVELPVHQSWLHRHVSRTYKDIIE